MLGFLATNKILRSRPSNWLCYYYVILFMTALTIFLWNAKSKQKMLSCQDAPDSQMATTHVQQNDPSTVHVFEWEVR